MLTSECGSCLGEVGQLIREGTGLPGMGAEPQRPAEPTQVPATAGVGGREPQDLTLCALTYSTLQQGAAGGAGRRTGFFISFNPQCTNILIQLKQNSPHAVHLYGKVFLPRPSRAPSPFLLPPPTRPGRFLPVSFPPAHQSSPKKPLLQTPLYSRITQNEANPA